VPLLWGELGTLLPLLHQQRYDETIMRGEAALFGIDWHSGGPVFDPPRWLDELMFGAYFSFYALLVLPPLFMAIGGERRVAALRDLVLRIMLTYMVCNLLDVVFPVVGPAGDSRPIVWSHGLFFGLTAAATHLGDSLGTSFPSTHVAVSAAIAWGAWRWYRWPTAALLTAIAVLIAISTVYTRNHYILDVAAAAVVVVVVQALAVPALRHASEGGGDGVE
jgi:membrane-associated phospholipid phosphatase